MQLIISFSLEYHRKEKFNLLKAYAGGWGGGVALNYGSPLSAAECER